jgi:hypothetical protein
MRAGLHGWKGSNAFEGSNPSLRKQSISRQICHRVGAKRSARMPSELQRLNVAGSNPAGRIARCAVAQWQSVSNVSIEIVVRVAVQEGRLWKT